MPPNTFIEPSLGFAQVMGVWNPRESLTDDLPDIARMGVGKTKEGQKQFHMRASTMARKKSLVKTPSNLDHPKMTSAQKWGQILTTSTQLMKAKRKIRSIQASRVKLHNTIAKKLIEIPSFTPPVHTKSDEDAQLIKDAIQCNFLFDKLSEDDLKPFIDAFELKHYIDGDIIIKQGDPGDYFYIVKTGEAMFYVEEEFVGTAPRGASFGDVALLYTCPQAATVMAVSDDTALFRVDQMCFRRVSKARTEKIDKDKIGLLKAMECFKDVDKDDLKRLSETMVAMVYKEGDILHNGNDKNPPFCVVQEGELMVTKKMGQGDFFGEESLNLTSHSFGTATAVTDGLAYTIDRATFERVFGNLGRLVTKSLDKQKLAAIPVLRGANLGEAALDTLARHIEDQIFKPNWKMFSIDEETEAALYLVRDGCVKITDKDGCEELVGPGGYFGEDQLLVDTGLSIRPDISGSTTITARSTAIAVEKTTLGLLTLDECRAVFDTTAIGHGAYNEQRESKGPDPEEDDTDDELDLPIPVYLTTKAKLEDLTHHHLLGEGQFGEVWLVSSKVDDDPRAMALKTQTKDPYRPDDSAAYEEITIMKNLRHTFVVNLIQSYEDDQHIHILMPAAPGGDLFDIIFQLDDDGNEIAGLEEKQAKFYAAVIADALSYLHKQRILYRDLKPENVLIDAQGYPVIIDFGLSMTKRSHFAGLHSTPPPEIITNRGHGLSADNWSLGVLIYTLLEGANPFYFSGMDPRTLYHMIIKDNYYPLSKEASLDARSIVDGLLEKDPGKRLGAFRLKDVFSHPWFSDVNLKELRQKHVTAPWIPDAIKLEE